MTHQEPTALLTSLQKTTIHPREILILHDPMTGVLQILPGMNQNLNINLNHVATMTGRGIHLLLQEAHLKKRSPATGQGKAIRLQAIHHLLQETLIEMRTGLAIHLHSAAMIQEEAMTGPVIHLPEVNLHLQAEARLLQAGTVHPDLQEAALQAALVQEDKGTFEPKILFS